MSPAVAIFRGSLLAIAIVAFLYGGRTEKQVAAIYVLAAALTFVGRRRIGLDYLDFEGVVTWLDLALLACLAIIAVRVRTWWLIASVALQLITCLGHLAKYLDPKTSPMGYFMMLVSSSYPAVILLAIGIWQHRKIVRDRTMRDRSSAGSSRRAAPRRRS